MDDKLTSDGERALAKAKNGDVKYSSKQIIQRIQRTGRGVGEQNLFIVFAIREKASSCQCLVGKFFLIFLVVLKIL